MTELLLLADSDILIHFFRGNKLKLLPKILPNKICLLDAVVAELQYGRSPTLYDRIMKEIGSSIILEKFTDKPLIYNEWVKLVRADIGSGESACLAMARYEGHHIASSNLRDINDYCKDNKIRVYTTMDLIHEAYTKGLLTEDDCDSFIIDVLDAGSRLPCSTFAEYLAKHASKSPWRSYDRRVA
ncbi:MAG: hypothetical protein JWP12_1617 [Bacteroidetes bacterium]|nr:hypothetical protein [Bacteroidota bacterium]